MSSYRDFKIVLRPNNQVTLTLQNTIKKQKLYHGEVSIDKISKESVNRYVRRLCHANGLQSAYSHNLKREYILPPVAPLPLPLDIIDRFQRLKKGVTREKLGYGKTPKIKYFGRKAGQKIRETGGVIDRLCDGSPERCRVVTLTLPSSDQRAYRAISDYSGYAVNRLFQVVRRDYQNAHWFYVYEHQKRGALHLHICVYDENPDISREIGVKLCEKWRDILVDISAKVGVNLLHSKGFGRECLLSDMQLDNQPMRKGCGAYFSKYASKNSGKYSDDINSVNARRYPPSSFWGRSRELSRMCEDNSFSFKYEGVSSDDSESLQAEAFELLSQLNIVLSHSFSFKKQIELGRKYGGGSLTICEGESNVFYLSPSDYDRFLVVCKDRFSVYDSSKNLQNRMKNT